MIEVSLWNVTESLCPDFSVWEAEQWLPEVSKSPGPGNCLTWQRYFANAVNHLEMERWSCITPESRWHHQDPYSRNVGRASSVQSLSHVQLFATPWTAAHKASLSITNSWSLLKLTSIESMMPSNHLILWDEIVLLPSIFPSIRVFSNESVLCIRWQKYWNFSFNISPSNEYSGLISFRMDWLDLLAVQGILKSLLQHHNSKASILRHLAFFIVQLSHPYMTSGKTIALTRYLDLCWQSNVSAFQYAV